MSVLIENPGMALPAKENDASGRVLVAVMALAVALRLCVFGVGLFSVWTAAPGAVPQINREHPWIAWDAINYYEVAQNGYAPDRIGRPFREGTTFALIGYFPLVPLVSRGLSELIPLGVAMVTLSNVCSIIGLAFLFDWARRITNARTATICLLLTATFPGAVALAAGMTEGPFLMLAAITLWLLEQDKFYFAAIVAGVGTASRPTGVALAAIVPFYAWMRQTGLSMRQRLTHLILIGAISLSGAMLYEGFLWYRYQSPTVYFQAQSHWSDLDQARMQQEAVQGVKRYSWEFFQSRLVTPQAWNRLLALGVIVITLAGFFKPQGIPRLLFVLPLIIFVMTCLPGHGLRISSVPRYESAAAPLFLLLAIWLSGRRLAPILGAVLLVLLAIQLYYAYLFPRQIWVG